LGKVEKYWEINGIEGFGDLPEIADSFSGPLVILGGASCLWDDLAQVKGNPTYMAINETGCFARKNISHWATKHPSFLPHYLGWYKEYYFPTNTENKDFNFFAHVFKPHIHTHAPKDAENIWQFINEKGSSGLFAVHVGLALGYNPIWLTGIPLEPMGNLCDPPWIEPFTYDQYQKFWEIAAERFGGRVKSFSGFTRKLLGAPIID
jgi:hypothetical protein